MLFYLTNSLRQLVSPSSKFDTLSDVVDLLHRLDVIDAKRTRAYHENLEKSKGKNPFKFIPTQLELLIHTQWHTLAHNYAPMIGTFSYYTTMMLFFRDEHHSKSPADYRCGLQKNVTFKEQLYQAIYEREQDLKVSFERYIGYVEPDREETDSDDDDPYRDDRRSWMEQEDIDFEINEERMLKDEVRWDLKQSTIEALALSKGLTIETYYRSLFK